MSCIDWKGAALAALIGLTLMSGCSPRRESPPPTATPSRGLIPTPAPAPATGRARNWEDFQVIAGRRLVSANPSGTYMDTVPDVLLAIPVLEIELNGDGSVRKVNVQRTPGQATDTVQLAVDAVYRGAPYGDVTHLPRPWRYSETFLFRDDRRFKPRSLDQ